MDLARRHLVVLLAAAILALAGPVPMLQAADPATKHYRVVVEGMTCPSGCANRVRELVSSIEGVSAVQVDFPKKTVDVEVKPGATLTVDAINAVFQGTPYAAKTISETP